MTIQVFEGIVGVIEAIGAILAVYWSFKYARKDKNEKPND